jgi:subtilase family serine protease
MKVRLLAGACAVLSLAAIPASPAVARVHRRTSRVIPLAVQAPDSANAAAAAGHACDAPPAPDHPAGVPEPYYYSAYHCYTPAQMTHAYGVDTLQGDPADAGAGLKGAGQTIVLVDSYGTPTAQHDLQVCHDTFYPSLPGPDFDQVCQPGCKDYKNVGSGESGSSGAEGWAGEANLDIEWAYAMAPLAHIILVGVPPAETEGVQGFPNLFKEISDEIDATPSGTVFSMSFGVTEQTFGGSSAKSQLAKFDAVFKKGLAKNDTFMSSSGDDGSAGVGKQQRDSRYYGHPVVGWPASSPWVTAVGGTQLMEGWTWDPQSTIPFNADGSRNDAYFNWNDTPGSLTEPAWNEPWLPAATGGGESLLYGAQSWQSGVTNGTGNAPASRAVPDVAWNAAVNGGALVYTSFFPQTDRQGWHVYGGTSAASPQFAGVVALANEARANANKTPVGYLNPKLYQQVNTSTAFRDVTSQTFGTGANAFTIDSNQLYSSPLGQPVAPTNVAGMPVTSSWDETTGFGVPHADDLVSQLAALP